MRPNGANRVLFISNGHGEDSIAGTIIDRLRALDASRVDVQAWPMVGRGDALRDRGIPIRGVANTLPSEGFATLSTAMMSRDLRAGWIGTHLRQVRAARAMRGEFDLVVAVGDIVPVLAARLMRAPFVFVGCAKSEYYAPRYRYQSYERLLLKKALITFPRDERTTQRLESRGVRARYVGNPMMDELEPTGETFGIESDAVVFACLPGSRVDAPRNAARLLDVLAELGALVGATPPAFGVFALPSGFDVDAVSAPAGWRRAPALTDADRGIDMCLDHQESRMRAVFVRGRLADALHRADLVIGLAGTANEQAVGLGKPVVTFATDGSQGKDYLSMKMTYFGEAALEVPADARGAARAIKGLLADPARRARMASAGRERMGAPGGGDAIARAISTVLSTP